MVFLKLIDCFLFSSDKMFGNTFDNSSKVYAEPGVFKIIFYN